jgi:hypothetical protein
MLSARNALVAAERTRLKAQHDSLNEQRDILIKLTKYIGHPAVQKNVLLQEFQQLIKAYKQCYEQYREFPETCWDRFTSRKVAIVLDRHYCQQIFNLYEKY